MNLWVSVLSENNYHFQDNFILQGSLLTVNRYHRDEFVNTYFSYKGEVSE